MLLSVLASVVIARVLKDDERVFFLGRDHDLVLLAADAYELHVVLGVERLDGALRLGSELRYQRAVLDRVVLRHRAANRYPLRIHHDNALHSLVRVYTVDRLLHFLRL
jgi:hypothetical protein